MKTVEGDRKDMGHDRKTAIMLLVKNPLVRQKLRAIAEREPDLEVVAEESGVAEARTAAKALRPDVVVLDDCFLSTHDSNPASSTIGALRPARVIALGLSGDREQVMHALRSGACGFLRTQDAAEELAEAVRTARPEAPFIGAAADRDEVQALMRREARNPRVLIVDDDPDFCELVGLWLEPAEYEVFTAASREEGMALLHSVRPDAVVLDVMMPDGTEGFHFVWELRKHQDESLRSTPILMITSINERAPLRIDPAQGDGEFSPREYLPVDDFVEKPISPGLLLQKVKALVESRRGQAGQGKTTPG